MAICRWKMRSPNFKEAPSSKICLEKLNAAKAAVKKLVVDPEREDDFREEDFEEPDSEPEREESSGAALWEEE